MGEEGGEEFIEIKYKKQIKELKGKLQSLNKESGMSAIQHLQPYLKSFYRD